MIKFQGELSNKCKKYILTQYLKTTSCILLLSGIIIGVVLTISLYFTYPKWRDLIMLICPISAGIMTIIMSMPPLPKDRYKLYPTCITISMRDGNLSYVVGNIYTVKSVADVKRVVDMGEWYRLYGFNLRGTTLVCQKDLITEGSLEDFEMLFDGKIEKKS